jgi:hypothetical protein
MMDTLQDAVQEARERERELTLRRLRAYGEMQEAIGLERAAGSGDKEEREIVSEAVTIARANLAEIDRQLEQARADKRREQLRLELPGLESKLERARQIVERRNRIAEGVQNALEVVHAGLGELDTLSEELHAIERDPEARGVGSTAAIFHRIHSAQRLRGALAGAIADSSYRRAVRAPLLRVVTDEDFAHAEAAAGQKLIRAIEDRIRSIRGGLA